MWKALVLVLNLYGIANIIYDSQQAGGVVLKLILILHDNEYVYTLPDQ